MIQQCKICGCKQQGKDFRKRGSKNFRVHSLLMVSLEKWVGLSGNSCHKQSSHLLGLVKRGRVRRKMLMKRVEYQSQVNVDCKV